MQEYEKRILQCVLAEKITPMDLKKWLLFHLLKPEFISQIHMVLVYSTGIRFIIFSSFHIVFFSLLRDIVTLWHSEIGSNNEAKTRLINNEAIILMKDKNVYSLGYSDLGYIHTAIYPKKIKELCGKNIKTFAHSDYCILALTEEGEVYQRYYYIS